MLFHQTKVAGGDANVILTIFLFKLSGNVQIWDAYLTFLTSYFTGFTLSKITNAYKDCFQRIQTMTGQAFRSDDHIGKSKF